MHWPYLSRHCAVAGPGENMATGYNNWNDVIMAFYNEVRNAWPAPAANVTGQGHNVFFSMMLAD